MSGRPQCRDFQPGQYASAYSLHKLSRQAVHRSGHRCRASRPELPPELLRARRLQRTGLALSSALVLSSAATLALRTSQLQVPEELPASVLAAGGALAALYAVLSQSGVQAEVHNGRLYLSWGGPLSGPPLEPGAVEVRPSGPGRGNGAFAVREIPQGVCLGSYEGELIDEATYWARYPSGRSDFCIGIDRDWTLDGAQRVKDTATFSPCHMNHSLKRSNVQRSCRRSDKQVLFFTARPIQAGEELLFNYGAKYWTGREDQLVE